MQKFIEYDGATFKCIARVPKYQEYTNVFVAKEPHYDQDGRSYQVINTNWRGRGVFRPIKPYVHPNGYMGVNLPVLDGQKRLKSYVHRLVYLAWAGELPENYEDLQINHRDEDRQNNRLSNLELVTAAQNNNYGGHNLRVANSMVKSGHTAAVVAINISTGHEYRYDTLHECARQLEVDASNVCKCLTGRYTRHRGYVFCHEDEYTPALVDQLIAAATRRK